MKPDADVLVNPLPFVRRAIYASNGSIAISASTIADKIIAKRPALASERDMLTRVASEELRRLWGA